MCLRCAQFSAVAAVTYPEVYERFLQAVDVFNLDLGWMLSAGCLVSDLDFHSRLFCSTLGPLIVLAVLGSTYTAALHRTMAARELDETARAEWRKGIRRAHGSAVLLLTFIVYSSVSSTLFRMFACESLDDGERYLRADYRILCTDSKHRTLQVYAGFMIMLYPVGIPALYAVILYRLRNVPRDGDSDPLSLADASAAADLWEPYKPSCFYYEVRSAESSFSPCCQSGSARNLQAGALFCSRDCRTLLCADPAAREYNRRMLTS